MHHPAPKNPIKDLNLRTGTVQVIALPNQNAHTKNLCMFGEIDLNFGRGKKESMTTGSNCANIARDGASNIPTQQLTHPLNITCAHRDLTAV